MGIGGDVEPGLGLGHCGLTENRRKVKSMPNARGEGPVESSLWFIQSLYAGSFGRRSSFAYPAACGHSCIPPIGANCPKDDAKEYSSFPEDREKSTLQMFFRF